MRAFMWIAGAIGFIALIAVLVAANSKLSALAVGVILVTGLAVSGVFESLEQYLPGGSKNPYRADTVDKLNYWAKLAIWLGAVCTAIAIWGISILVLQYVS